MDSYKQRLSDKFEQKICLKKKAIGYCLYGPHRDDYDILINGKSVFHFYSRGINRIVSVFLMKVAQLRLIQSVYDTFPMLLLDDTFAELDLKNKNINKNFENIQLLFTQP